MKDLLIYAGTRKHDHISRLTFCVFLTSSTIFFLTIMISYFILVDETKEVPVTVIEHSEFFFKEKDGIKSPVFFVEPASYQNFEVKYCIGPRHKEMAEEIRLGIREFDTEESKLRMDSGFIIGDTIHYILNGKPSKNRWELWELAIGCFHDKRSLFVPSLPPGKYEYYREIITYQNPLHMTLTSFAPKYTSPSIKFEVVLP